MSTTPAVQPYDTLALNDDIGLQRGSHQLSFGVNFMNVRAFAVNDLNTNGNITFSGQGGTGSAMGDFIYGKPVSFTSAALPLIQSQRPGRHLAFTRAGYVEA